MTQDDDVAEFIGEAIAAIQAGQRARARVALTRAISCEPRNELAWLWMSAAVDSPAEQAVVLQRILEINPANRHAQEGLQALKSPLHPSTNLSDFDQPPAALSAIAAPAAKALADLAHRTQPLNSDQLPAHPAYWLSEAPPAQPDGAPSAPVAQPAILAHQTQLLNPDPLPAHPNLPEPPAAPLRSSAEILAALVTAPLAPHANWLLDDLSRRALLRDQGGAADLQLSADPNPELLPPYPGLRSIVSPPAPGLVVSISAAVNQAWHGAALQADRPAPAEQAGSESVTPELILVAHSLTGPGVSLAAIEPAIDSWDLSLEEPLVCPIPGAAPSAPSALDWVAPVSESVSAERSALPALIPAQPPRVRLVLAGELESQTCGLVSTPPPAPAQPLPQVEQTAGEPLAQTAGSPTLGTTALAGAEQIGAEQPVIHALLAPIQVVHSRQIALERPGPERLHIRRSAPASAGTAALPASAAQARQLEPADSMRTPGLRLLPALSPELPLLAQPLAQASAALAPDLAHREALVALSTPDRAPLRHTAPGATGVMSKLAAVQSAAQPISSTALAVQPISAAAPQAEILPTLRERAWIAPQREATAGMRLTLERQPATQRVLAAAPVVQSIGQVGPARALPVRSALLSAPQSVALTGTRGAHWALASVAAAVGPAAPATKGLVTSHLPAVQSAAQPANSAAAPQARVLPTLSSATSIAPQRESPANLRIEREPASAQRAPRVPAASVVQSIAQVGPDRALPVRSALVSRPQSVALTGTPWVSKLAAAVVPEIHSWADFTARLVPMIALLTQAPDPALQAYGSALSLGPIPAVLRIAEPIAAGQPSAALAEAGLDVERLRLPAGLTLEQPHSAPVGQDFIAELGLEEGSVTDPAPPLAARPTPPGVVEQPRPTQQPTLRLNFLGEVVAQGSVAEPGIASAAMPLVIAPSQVKVPTLNPGPQPEIIYVPAARPMRLSRWSTLTLWGYLLLITLAEYLTAFYPQLGLSLHATMLLGLVAQASLSRNEDERNLCLGLTLAPLIRLLSLSLPLPTIPQLGWYPLVSVPLLMATWIIVRQTGLTRRMIGLRKGDLSLQLMLVGLGFGLGAIEFIILQPPPILASFSVQSIALAAVILTIFTGFTEEIIFRGVLQRLASPLLRSTALIYVSALFAVLHIGYVSLADVLFVFAVGLVFAWLVDWSNSILGVTLAHGLTNVTLFLIMPFVADSFGDPLAPITWIVALGTIMGLVAIRLIYQRAQRARYVPQSFPAYVHNLRRLRLERRLSRKALAQQAGISVAVLIDLERGRRPITPFQLASLARALGTSLREFTALDDPPPPALTVD